MCVRRDDVFRSVCVYVWTNECVRVLVHCIQYEHVCVCVCGTALVVFGCSMNVFSVKKSLKSVCSRQPYMEMVSGAIVS